MKRKQSSQGRNRGSIPLGSAISKKRCCNCSYISGFCPTSVSGGTVNVLASDQSCLDSSLRDVKEDDSNNEVAPSRGGEQIDDVLDGFVGAVVGGFKSAVWAILRVRTAVEAAVGKWSAQPFVEEQKKQRDLNTL